MHIQLRHLFFTSCTTEAALHCYLHPLLVLKFNPPRILRNSYIKLPLPTPAIETILLSHLLFTPLSPLTHSSPVSPLFPFQSSFLLGIGASSHPDITTVPLLHPDSICLFQPASWYHLLVYNSTAPSSSHD